MRRQVFEKGGGGIPFAENLIFYAPLTENDLTDHISGEALRTNSTNVTWNTTHNMYDIQKSGAGSAYFQNLNLGLPFTSSDYSQVSCTCVFDYIKTLTSDTLYCNLVGLAKGYNNSGHRFPLFFMKFVSPAITVNVKYQMAWTLNNGVFKFYIDGNEVNLNSPYSAADSFDYNECNTYVSLAAGNWSGNNGGGCFGNIRIYDRALTASEVAQL
ncbi:MAG: hypothetical protein J6S87_01850 [Bacteroidales bacterium]|nr:hypothetical protein [Bacteroidales bacterium]